MINYNDIPAGRLVPFVSMEFDSSKSQQGPSLQPYKVLLMGQKLSAGTEDELTLRTITSEAEARTRYGAGSMVHLAAKAWFNVNKSTELVVCSIDDASGGTAATGKIAWAASSAKAGTIHGLIAGQKFTVGVSDGDTATEICAAVVAAIQALGDMPVTAAVNGSEDTECDLTAKNKGTLGNKIDIRFNYFPNQEFPSGVTPTVTAMSSGATDPDIAEIIGVLTETQFNDIITPWADASSLSALETELADRFGPDRQIDGEYHACLLDTLSNNQTALGNRNSLSGVIATPFKSAPFMPYEYAAAQAGRVAASSQSDPGLPYKTLPLSGLLAPAETERFTDLEKDLLLKAGGSVASVDSGGVVRLLRVVTTYKTNASGAPDAAYRNLSRKKILSYIRYDFNNTAALRFDRFKAAGDDVEPSPGQKVVTPKLMKGFAVEKLNQWAGQVLIENVEAAKKALVVERNEAEPDRFDVLLPFDVVNQFYQLATQSQFLV